MSTKNNYKCNFETIIDRLKLVSGKNKQYEIGNLLGFEKDTFAARKARQSIPEKEIELACLSNGWSFKYVMTGEGEPIQLSTLVAEEMISYGGFPEPIRKTIELMLNNPERAWELYAALLERLEK